MSMSICAGGRSLVRDDWNHGNSRISAKGHRNSASSSVSAALGWTGDTTIVIEVDDDVFSRKIGAKRDLVHRRCWIGLDKTILRGLVNELVDEIFPSHSAKIFMSRNDAQGTNSHREEQIKADFLVEKVAMNITDTRVSRGFERPKVLPVVALPQLSEEPGLDLLSETNERFAVVG